MYNKTTLDCGIRVISEEISHVRSVSVGIWILSGARHEDNNLQGISHFLEHMLFKGTPKRTAFDIAVAIDSIGGIMNACTSKELTSFYIKVPDYHLDKAIELLADMFGHSLFDVGEMEKEKSVITQEIRLVEDTPDEYVHDFFESLLWDGQSLGRPILGTESSVKGLTRDNLYSHFSSRYRGKNLIISATGNVKHQTLVRLLHQAFGPMGLGDATLPDTTPRTHSRIAVIERDLEQVHLVLGAAAPSATSEKRYASFLINAILGGCMSSRLFQEIRERRALAYAIHSYLNPYMDTGLFGVYAGVGEDKVGEVVAVIVQELENLATVMVPAKELCAAKELIKGNFLLSMESTDNRMTRLAKNECCMGRFVTMEEVTACIDAVTPSEILLIAQEMFNRRDLSLAAMGKVKEDGLRKVLDS